VTVLEALAHAVQQLNDANASFALVGGLAVSVRAEPRFTKDADFAIAVANDLEAESIVRGFLGAGYAMLADLEQETTGRLATVRLVAPSSTGDGPVVDLLFASAGIEPEVAGAATVEELAPGLHIPVATIGHLIAMKVLSEGPARFQDSADLVALIRLASKDDMILARTSVGLMQERGSTRTKDLRATLDRYVRIAAEQ
jgi:hypothetical protein